MAEPRTLADTYRRLSTDFRQESESQRPGFSSRQSFDIDVIAPIVDWNTFIDKIFVWDQSQHVGLIGPTGAGKTTLALHILDERQYVTVFGTKPKDETLTALVKRGYRLMKEWKSWDPGIVPKRLLWPKADRLYAARHQRQVFQKAFDAIYPQGGWCIFIDELWFIIHHLKLELEIRTFLMQSRSNDISLVLCTQRPSRVPLEVYDQSEHLFFWQDNDETNLRRIAGISWANGKAVMQIVSRLDKYQFLYASTRTSKMYRVTPPPSDEAT